MKKFDIINSGKSVIFNTPLEKENIMIRTGTIADGSCFVHSTLTALNDDYNNMSIQEKQDIAFNLRKSIANDITVDVWERIANGIVSKVGFEIILKQYCEYMYILFSNRDVKQNTSKLDKIKRIDVLYSRFADSPDKKDVYMILSSIIPLDMLYEKIIDRALSNNSVINDSVEEILKKIRHLLKNNSELSELDKDKRKSLINMYTLFFDKIAEYAKQKAYKSYVESIENPTEYVDISTIGLYANKLNRDIYIIEDETRMPYRMSYTEEIVKNRKSILILWIKDKEHYEILGRLNNGVIQREFSPNDPLVAKIKNIVFDNTL